MAGFATHKLLEIDK